ncbi:hypothetical protein AURDEDRAFT_126976 [Auricularia subglabra TFB-10046 SS5]|nr:hypothetical protein AURDEDRAFT_126976 [Auricularia subglabra TFB-10046 SS5]
MFAFTTAVLAAGNSSRVDYSCYFKCARDAPSVRNYSNTQADTQCVSQQDEAKVFRCICKSPVLQRDINKCMVQACITQVYGAEFDLAAVGCDVSDGQLKIWLSGVDPFDTSAATRTGALWSLGGSAVLGAALLFI